jgi:hypothetical protein
VELTAEASRVLDDALPVTPFLSTASLDATPRPEPQTVGPTDAAAQATAPVCVATAEARGGELLDSGSITDMVVRIAKECQDVALNNIKASANAALDLAKRLAENRPPSDVASKDDGGASLDASTTVFQRVAAEIQTEAFDLMEANVNAALEYARELAATTTGADVAELSGTHARKQCELMLKQASSLQSLAQTIAKSGTD